jgi:hypothetical protein
LEAQLNGRGLTAAQLDVLKQLLASPGKTIFKQKVGFLPFRESAHPAAVAAK